MTFRKPHAIEISSKKIPKDGTTHMTIFAPTAISQLSFTTPTPNLYTEMGQTNWKDNDILHYQLTAWISSEQELPYGKLASVEVSVLNNKDKWTTTTPVNISYEKTTQEALDVHQTRPVVIYENIVKSLKQTVSVKTAILEGADFVELAQLSVAAKPYQDNLLINFMAKYTYLGTQVGKDIIYDPQ